MLHCRICNRKKKLAMNKKKIVSLVRKPSSAVEKAAPGAKRILSGMVKDRSR